MTRLEDSDRIPNLSALEIPSFDVEVPAFDLSALEIPSFGVEVPDFDLSALASLDVEVPEFVVQIPEFDRPALESRMADSHGTTTVRGYVRRDGAHVRPHTRRRAATQRCAPRP